MPWMGHSEFVVHIINSLIDPMKICITVLFVWLICGAWGAKPLDPAFARNFDKQMCKDAKKITCVGGDYDLKCMCSSKECYWSCNRKYWKETEEAWKKWNKIHGMS